MRVVAIQSAHLQTQSYSPDGLLAGLSVAQTNSVSNTLLYGYDGFDRPASVSYPNGGTETFAYDANGNLLTRKTRANQNIVFTYDNLNRVRTKAPAGQPVVTYGYDLAGRAVSVSDTSAAIASALPPSGGTISFASTTSYDALNRPLAVSWSPAAAPAVAPAASSAAFSFGYNRANQRVTQTANDNSWWAYPAGPSAVSYAANSLDQYSAIGAVTPTYDANGNLTFDGTFTFGYDPENRMTSVMQGATSVAAYAFDGLGRRKQKTAGAVKTVFVTDADNREVLEYDGVSGQVQNWYAYGPGPNEAFAQMNVPASTRASFIPDVQGSVQAVLASATGVLTKAGFQPFQLR